MKYEVVELEELSGPMTTIYSVYFDDDDECAFDQFIAKNSVKHREELKEIIKRLKAIGNLTGAREQFFKPNEGQPGDGVCALYDEEQARLRLYCIRYGSAAIILGSGGPKPPEIRRWQDDPALAQAVNKMIDISKNLTQKLRSGEIRWVNNGTKLEGDLKSDEDE